MIRRRPRAQGGFTIVSNQAIEDDRLTFRALGILTWVLSKPDNWTGTASGEAGKGGREGRDAIRTAMRELESAGYARLEKTQGEHGHWASTWVVGDLQDFATDDGFSGAGPTPGEPTVGFPGPIPLQTQNKTPECGSDDDPVFVKFWDAYPRKVDKGHARKAWRAAVKRGLDPDQLVDAARGYGAACQTARTQAQYIPYPATWLNGERYEDQNHQRPERPGPQVGGIPVRM